MLRKLLIVATVFSVALVLSACESMQDSSTQPSTAPDMGSMGMLNDRCPVTGEPVDPDTTVSYMGNKIGMCCAGCKGPWEKMSDEKKMAVVKKYTK